MTGDANDARTNSDPAGAVAYASAIAAYRIALLQTLEEMISRAGKREVLEFFHVADVSRLQDANSPTFLDTVKVRQFIRSRPSDSVVVTSMFNSIKSDPRTLRLASHLRKIGEELSADDIVYTIEKRVRTNRDLFAGLAAMSVDESSVLTFERAGAG